MFGLCGCGGKKVPQVAKSKAMMNTAVQPILWYPRVQTLTHLETKWRPSTLRGYRQMWNRYLKPRCANLVMHDAETRTVQTLLDTISTEDKLAPQTMAHVKHLVGGMFHFAIAQGHLPRGTINPVTFAETKAIPDFDGRAYSLEEIAPMLSVLPEPSRTVVALAGFTGLRAGEVAA